MYSALTKQKQIRFQSYCAFHCHGKRVKLLPTYKCLLMAKEATNASIIEKA